MEEQLHIRLGVASFTVGLVSAAIACFAILGVCLSEYWDEFIVTRLNFTLLYVALPISAIAGLVVGIKGLHRPGAKKPFLIIGMALSLMGIATFVWMAVLLADCLAVAVT